MQQDPFFCIKKIDFSSQITRDTSQFPAPSTNLILAVIIGCIAGLHQQFDQTKIPTWSSFEADKRIAFQQQQILNKQPDLGFRIILTLHVGCLVQTPT